MVKIIMTNSLKDYKNNNYIILNISSLSLVEAIATAKKLKAEHPDKLFLIK